MCQYMSLLDNNCRQWKNVQTFLTPKLVALEEALVRGFIFLTGSNMNNKEVIID